MAPMRQQTLKSSVSFQGIGVHSGLKLNMTVRPSAGGRILFRRLDLGGAEIDPEEARMDSNHCSILVSPQGEVQTVEHLTAALYMLGLDSVLVELDGPEIPIMDGSAQPFAESLSAAGIQQLDSERTVFKVTRPFRLSRDKAFVEVTPDDKLRVTYSIEFDHAAIGRQEISLELDTAAFLSEIAPARTFGFLKDVEALRKSGLAHGASLENTLVLDEQGIINGPLRFQDEFVRHKVLDLVGDLALFSRPLYGHFSVGRGGHDLHHSLIRHLRAHPELFSSVG
jgi:UDP-3-O-[3-hydroxymyristoyl] N-acetylglucosamine deacetylase